MHAHTHAHSETPRMLYFRRIADLFVAPNHAMANDIKVFIGDSAAPIAGAVAATAPITFGTTTVNPQTLKNAVSNCSTPAESALVWKDCRKMGWWLRLGKNVSVRHELCHQDTSRAFRRERYG